MKTITLITALAGLCAVARAGNLQTIDGATYQNYVRQRADPDGLVIEYSPPGGGMGVAKVKFARLSPDQQKQFGYDQAKASEFEAQTARAEEDFRVQALQWESAARAARTAAAAQELQAARQENERMLALAQLTAAQAELARASSEGSGNNNYGGGYWGGGYGLVAVPALNGSLRSLHGGLQAVPHRDFKNPPRNPLFPKLPIRLPVTAP